MKLKFIRLFHKALSILCASFIGILTVLYSVSIPAYAVHTGGGGSLFGGVDGDTMTGAELKSLASDYSNQYVPMSTVDQYKWSWQDCQGTKSTYVQGNGVDFYPLPPIYTYTSGQWGNKGWSECYVLYFAYDDDVGVYYDTKYMHIYSTRSDDGNALLNFDYYNLSDNSLDRAWSTSWNIERQYIGIDRNYTICTYKSYSDYLGNTSPLYPLNTYIYSYNARGYLKTGNLTNGTSALSSSTFTPSTNPVDDCGFILSSKPFYLFCNQTSINFDNIPDNYIITISGDTIYDYSITNPDTGDTSTINYYITNNYTLPESSSDDPADNGGSSSSGSTSGNFNVSGEVVVGGQIDIKSDPIDINVNVNMGTSEGNNSSVGSSEGVQFDEDISLNNYYDWMNEQTTGFSGFMKQFFNWLPPDILIMICAGFGLVILARFLGR